MNKRKNRSNVDNKLPEITFMPLLIVLFLKYVDTIEKINSPQI